LVPANFQTQLADSAWKVRLEAAEEMIKWTEEEGAAKVDSEILIRFLGKYPGWNEKNFQVCQTVKNQLTKGVGQSVQDYSDTCGKELDVRETLCGLVYRSLDR
jgi:hypothetical protein